jgi:hypothetical protein
MQANRFGSGIRALLLNFVFTRVVNHCVTVVGLQGARRPTGTVGQSLLNRLRPNLNVEHEMTLGKKTTPVQYLRAIRLSLPRGLDCAGLGFVNHALLRFRLGLSQSVLEGRRCGVPTCARSGEEGDWHARIAD